MASIPPVKMLRKEDFPNLPDIEKLLRPLNEFLINVSNAFKNGLTFAENIAAQVKEVEARAAAFPITFKASLSAPVVGVVAIRAYDVDARTSTVGAPLWCDYTQSGDQIVVTNITGLFPGKRYTVTLFVFYGGAGGAAQQQTTTQQASAVATGVSPERWIAASPLLNGWVNYSDSNNSDAQYCRDLAGNVHLSGTVKNGTLGQPIFYLPTGYRPKRWRHIPCTTDTGYGDFYVRDDGAVVSNRGGTGYFTLTSCFRAEQ